MSKGGIPSTCYDDCDGAYKVGLSTGKSDKLCQKDSLFRGAYALCRECIADNTKAGSKVYIDPELQQFIEYCDKRLKSEITTVVTRTGTNGRTSIVLIASTQAEATSSTTGMLDSCESCSVLTFTDYRSQVVELTVDPNRITASLRRESSPTDTSTSKSSDTNDSPSGPDLAKIIGPIVPSVILLIILGFLGFRWFKQRKTAKAQHGTRPDEEEPKEGKAQLHSDCITRPTFELEGSTPVVIDDTATPKDKSEMPANEPAAHEMSTEKRITRKAVGSSPDNNT